MSDEFKDYDITNLQPRLDLLIELVPQTAWGKNLRSDLPKKDWDMLRKQTYEAAGHHCEICGGKGRKHPVECHEVWDYDTETRIQKLVRLIALCPSCHQVKHFGLAQLRGKEKQAVAHMMKVNGWTDEQAREHIREATELWNERSALQWSLDMTWLSSVGVAIP